MDTDESKRRLITALAVAVALHFAGVIRLPLLPPAGGSSHTVAADQPTPEMLTKVEPLRAVMSTADGASASNLAAAFRDLSLVMARNAARIKTTGQLRQILEDDATIAYEAFKPVAGVAGFTAALNQSYGNAFGKTVDGKTELPDESVDVNRAIDFVRACRVACGG